ncbi:hypothetical protein AAMO2058_000564400 [Amorphochlora amoebiformis]
MGKGANKSSRAQAGSTKALKLVKQDYKHARHLLTVACVGHVKKIEKKLDAKNLKILKAFLKKVFGSLSKKVETHVTVEGRKVLTQEEKDKVEKLKKLRKEVPERLRKRLDEAQAAKAPDKMVAPAIGNLPSERAIELAKENLDEINQYLSKIQEVVPGYMKASENLLKYIKGGASLPDDDLQEALKNLKNCSQVEGSKSMVSAKGTSKKGSVSRSLRSGRWR